MVFQDLYFWLGQINELKERDKYYTPVFNYLKYSKDKAGPCDNLYHFFKDVIEIKNVKSKTIR